MSTILNQCRLIPLAGGKRNLPTSGSFGTAYWQTEGGAKGRSTFTFTNKLQTLDTLCSLVVVSNQLLRDVFNPSVFLDFVLGEVARTLTLEKEKQLLVGDGNPKTGILNASGFSVVALETTLLLEYDDIINLMFTPKFGYGFGIFVTNQEGLASISEIKDTQGLPIFQDAKEGFLMTIKGRPVYVVDTSILPNTFQEDLTLTGGDNSVLFYGNFDNAILSPSGSMKISKSTEATINDVNMFENNSTAYRVEEDLDITIIRPEAFAGLAINI